MDSVHRVLQLENIKMSDGYVEENEAAKPGQEEQQGNSLCLLKLALSYSPFGWWPQIS